MRKFGKKGFANWVELSFFALLALGFVTGKLVVDATVSYLLLIVAGLIAGRLAYKHKGDDPWPFIAISLAFALGYLLAHRAGTGILLLIAFAAAGFASNMLHKHIDLA